ncbi:MAG: cob(I)yrinic acid a,c-diamide adenosyltransferase [Ignavibacterium album]|uniref:cob(I)yrinic acid a,c-diamide adenosyltransferase n=1 Tax=Ignavibacterium album TaxID=591197 RepID=UPI0026F2E9A2|nr:cob(I)yrinic acid a,c-diamide adenosyltransferase [Ignavibacterium album]MBI5661463.1 cob(I)yrinic acid a,c-diamide adenosyltransferase [Ignavibacterium album]
MKIYTKTGDKGDTSLFGGERVQKNHQRINAYGTVDELNAFIGLALTEIKSDEVRNILIDLQNKLFIVGSDLATPETEKNKKLNIIRTSEEFIKKAESDIDNFTEKLDELRNFILPGGSKGSAMLHVCRTICRRAEREIVALKNSEKVNQNILIFLNRISDLLFVLSRYENKVSNFPDSIWNPHP